MAVSSSATTALEDIAEAGGPEMGRWFQLSLSSRKVTNLGRASNVLTMRCYEAQYDMDMIWMRREHKGSVLSIIKM